LPQFFGEGDKLTLSPVVYNRLGRDEKFTVSLTLTNGKVLPPTQTITIAKDASQTVFFDVEIDNI
jgi:uncharacterized protein YfaS (alpha-2-macroglobulin family)